MIRYRTFPIQPPGFDLPRVLAFAPRPVHPAASKGIDLHRDIPVFNQIPPFSGLSYRNSSLFTGYYRT